MSGPFIQRTVVIGNSGSGKSTLAASLAALGNVSAIDLDLLHWDGDGYGMKREEAVAREMVREAAAAPGWAIEGVYGWLAEIALPRATALIWLDLPWALCRDSLLARGRRRGGTEADFAKLMAWAKPIGRARRRARSPAICVSSRGSPVPSADCVIGWRCNSFSSRF
ncbi:MAG: hypothetical protein WAN86_18350, partial [Hyphomicrobiaceae bacterium]